MYMVRNGKRINMRGCPADVAVEVTHNQAIHDNAGFELFNTGGQVVATVHPGKIEVLPWAQTRYGLKGDGTNAA
jgi:hypothetical protein